MSWIDDVIPETVATCDCEGEREWFSFRLSFDKYTCDWDNIHYIRDLKDYLLL